MNKKIHKILPFFLIGLLACSTETNNDPFTQTKIGFLTGEHGFTNTLSEWTLGGTDLGIPVYDDTTDTMYFLFGDSYSGTKETTIRSGMWRSNVIGVTKDFDASDGITFDSFLNNGRPYAKECLPGHHDPVGDGEISKIPTGGIFINGTLYVFFFSIREWGSGGVYYIQYNGVAKSEDKGNTFTYLPDLIWSTFNDEITSNLIEEDFGVTYSIDELESRNAPLFRQIFPKYGNDGYIYIYGVGGGRYDPSQCGRVKVEDFESFDKYEYLVGYQEDQTPIWETGKKGLKELAKENPFLMIDDLVSEPCVVYNEYLGKWIYQYQSYAAREIIGNASAERLVYSDHPYGPWSEPITYVSIAGTYGGFLHEKYMEDNGKTMYIFMSDWNEYNVCINKMTYK